MKKFEMNRSGIEIMSMSENIEYIKSWRKIRSLLCLMAFNSRDLSEEQRQIFLDKCYDMLFHSAAAVRRQAGETAAVLLAYAESSLVSLWSDLLHKLLFPDRNLEEHQTRWLSYSLMQIVSSASKKMSDTDRKLFLNHYVSYFKSARWPHITCLNLISGLLEAPPEMLNQVQRHIIFGFIRKYLSSESEDIVTLSLLLLMQWKEKGWEPMDDEQRYLNDFNLYKDHSFIKKYFMDCLTSADMSLKPELIPDFMQNNLLLDNDWTSKAANLIILKDYILGMKSDKYRFKGLCSLYADHLQTVLRLNEHPIVYFQACRLLAELMPYLDEQQKFEIFQENLKETETGVYSLNHAPTLLGHTFFRLNEVQQQGFINRFRELSDTKSEEIASDILEIVCIIMRFSALYDVSIPDSIHMTRIIARGLNDYRENISDEAAFLISHYLLNNDVNIKDRVLNRFLEKISGKTAEYDASFKNVAFFSGVFDPFTSKDKAIVKELLGMGFFVCIALNEFSYDKNPQPSRIRRRMLNMSTAGIENVYVIPEEISINTANTSDLEKLRSMFPGSSIYIVSEDKTINTLEDSAESSWPHIIYSDYDMHGLTDRDSICRIISAETVFLQLPARYQNINSSEIQRKVSQNKDISGMVDKRVQNMISEWRLYLDRPVYRKEVPAKEMLREFSDNMITVRIGDAKGSVKWDTAGKTAVITEIQGDISGNEDMGKLAVVEFLALCEKNECSHVVCFSAARYYHTLNPFGFVRMKDYEDGLTLDMSMTTVLFFDAMLHIKEPYCNDPGVIEQVRRGQARLQQVLTLLYPGKPVISFYSDILYYQLLELIKKNGTDGQANEICVPFGKMLKGVNNPNVIFKELNIEKQYSPDLYKFEICEMPEYPSLYAQIQTLKSLDKPLMFIDDLFHKGFRFEKVNSLFKNEGLSIKKMTAGVISGKGIKTAEEQDLSVSSVYQINNMRTWLLESELYPFIGGDGIESYKNITSHGGAIASINTILPYQMPTFFREASSHAVYNLSDVCINNALQIYIALEKVYFGINHKPLTLERIGEVMSEPRYPSDIIPDAHASEKVSNLLREELRKLHRLRYI